MNNYIWLNPYVIPLNANKDKVDLYGLKVWFKLENWRGADLNGGQAKNYTKNLFTSMSTMTLVLRRWGMKFG